MIEKLRWTHTAYRHLYATAPVFPARRTGTKEFAEGIRALTLHLKRPVWRDYGRENSRRAGAAFIRLAPEFDARPALVLGNGPSFRANLDLLERIPRDRCLFVAADRTLPVLWRRGVLPHFVVSLDSGDQVLPFYDGTPEPYLQALEADGWAARRGAGYHATRSGTEWERFQRDPKSPWEAQPWLTTEECRSVFEALVPGPTRGLDEIASLAGLAPRPIPLERLRALLALTANPHLGEQLGKRAFWYLPGFEPDLSRELEELSGLRPVPTAGNTGSTALNLCVILGARPVCLLGLEFSPGVPPESDASGGRAGRITPSGGSPTGDRPIDSNLSSYAIETRRLLKHSLLEGIFERAQVTNFSGGILHGPFIRDGDPSDLLKVVAGKASRPPAAPPFKRLERAALERLEQFTNAVAPGG